MDPMTRSADIQSLDNKNNSPLDTNREARVK